MPETRKVRIGWLKFMYFITIIVAGGLGLGILISPEVMQWTFNVSSPQIVSGIVGGTFIAFALASVLGLRNPLKFVPILLMQLIYKTIWLAAAILPLLAAGKVSSELIPAIVVFIMVIIGDLIAIPFSNIFEGFFKAKH